MLRKGWSGNSTKTVITEVLNLVTSVVPGASLFNEVIANQIQDALSWEYSEPVKMNEGIYEVSATASTQTSFDLPVLGTKAYEARLPFVLQVDVSNGSVSEWSVDLDNASVGEIETTP